MDTGINHLPTGCGFVHPQYLCGWLFGNPEEDAPIMQSVVKSWPAWRWHNTSVSGCRNPRPIFWVGEQFCVILIHPTWFFPSFGFQISLSRLNVQSGSTLHLDFRLRVPQLVDVVLCSFFWEGLPFKLNQPKRDTDSFFSHGNPAKQV